MPIHLSNSSFGRLTQHHHARSQTAAGTETGDLMSRLDRGLAGLRQRLGVRSQQAGHTGDSPTHPVPNASKDHHCDVHDSSHYARSIVYGPDLDGQADPGEVVWFWAPRTGHHGEHTHQGHLERAMVVVGHHNRQILGLLISPNNTHRNELNWLDIGSGPWDEAGRPSWIRLDKVVAIPENSIRRQGAILPQSRFERIASRLRTEFGWC